MELWHVRWRREQLHRGWVAWLQSQWGALSSGFKIVAPLSLGSPADAGFAPIQFAHPVGQIRNWGLAFNDGSRVHVHEFADGSFLAHRDAHDPARSLESTVAHLVHETPYPRWLAVAGLVVFAAKALEG
jgi:hypothetical protein